MNDLLYFRGRGRFGWFMVFNATFNNISAISSQSVLLVAETGSEYPEKTTGKGERRLCLPKKSL